MTEDSYFGKEQKYFYEKLDNGLEIYVAPNHKRVGYHIELVTKFGSEIDEFIPIGEKDYMKIPKGTAHFLEHKMFDSEDTDAFTFFSKTGTYTNAGTNYICTKYYAEGKKKKKKNLDFLITMVMTPYFTHEGVIKERGIINEEIKMYDDEPEFVFDYEMKKAVYNAHFQSKIAGTVESIQEINVDILNKVYKTFYQPSNMFIVISGNISRKDVLDILKNNQALNSAVTNYPIIYKEKKETGNIVDEYKKIEGNITYPKVKYSYKFMLDEFKTITGDMLILYLNSIFSCLFGDGSDFEENIYNKHIVTDYYLDHISYKNVYVLTLDAESEYADLFKEEIDLVLKNINITKEEFERLKRTWVSICIRGLDNIAVIASNICYSVLKKEKINFYSLIEQMNYEDCIKILNELKFDNKCFLLMVPKEDK